MAQRNGLGNWVVGKIWSGTPCRTGHATLGTIETAPTGNGWVRTPEAG